MYNKTGFLLSCILVTLLLVTVACAAPAPAPSPSPSPKPASSPAPAPLASPATSGEKVVISIGGGPAGSSKNFSMEAMANIIRKAKPEWTVKVVTGPAGYTEINMMGRGELNLANVEVFIIPDAKKGLYAFTQKLEKPVEFSWVVPRGINVAGIYINDSVPLQSIKDIKDKKYPLKVNTGRGGSTPLLVAQLLFQAYGFTQDDIKAWGGKIYEETTTRSVELLGDGIVEAVVLSSVVPFPEIDTLSKTKKLRMLTAKEPEAVAVLKKIGFEQMTVDAGTYNFVTSSTPAMGVPAVMAVVPGMDAKIAYGLTEALWGQRDALITLDPRMKPFYQPEIIPAWDKTFAEITSLHPGARKYYTEQGILK